METRPNYLKPSPKSIREKEKISIFLIISYRALSFLIIHSCLARKSEAIDRSGDHQLRHWDNVTLNANAPAKFAVISHFVIVQRNDRNYDITAIVKCKSMSSWGIEVNGIVGQRGRPGGSAGV